MASTYANSTPIAPAPAMMIDSGTESVMICSSYVTTRSLSEVPGSSRVVAPGRDDHIVEGDLVRAAAVELDREGVRVGEGRPAVDLGDLVLLHQVVHALGHPVGGGPAPLPGRPEVEGRVAADAEDVGLVVEEVGDLGVAEQGLGRDAADVVADPAPVLQLDDGRLQPELGGADRGHVPTRAGPQDHDVIVCSHGPTVGGGLLRRPLPRMSTAWAFRSAITHI